MKHHFTFNLLALAFVLLSNNGAWPELIPGQDPVCEYAIVAGNLLLAFGFRWQRPRDGSPHKR